MIGDEFEKDPGEKVDFTIDWGANGQLVEAETIASSTWVVPVPVTEWKASEHGDSTATVWLAGGVADRRYQVTNHVVTSEGRELEDSIFLCVREK